MPIKNKKTKTKFKFEKAFSIAEVVISMAILVVGIIAIMTLITHSINNSIDIRNQIIASQLAQEGTEIIRNIRDNNLASGAEEFANIAGSGTDTNKTDCRVDMYSTSIADADCGSSVDKKLTYSDSSVIGFYSHDSSGAATRFRRKINLEYVNTDVDALSDQLEVSVFVVWSNDTSLEDLETDADCNLGNNCVFAQETLTKQE